MLGSSRLLVLLVMVALLAAAAWFLLSDSAPLEPALATRDSTADSELIEPATLTSASGEVESAARSQVVPLGDSDARVVVTGRVWKLRISGKVVSGSDEAERIPGAQIELFLSDGNIDEGERIQELPPMVSDDSGEFSLEATVNADWYDAANETLYVEIRGSVWAAGYTHETFDVDLDLVEGSEADLTFELFPGSDVTGYVYNSHGDPVIADVYLHLDGLEESDSTTTDEDGSYRFHVETNGVASVRARGRSTGTAIAERVVIDSQVRTCIPDLFLAGSGSLGGVLVDPNGEPIAAYYVRLLAAQLITNVDAAQENWNYTLGDSQGNVSAERGDGSLFGTQTTQTDGSFLFEGLRPGQYMILVRSISQEGKVLASAKELFVTGELAARIVLGVHRLVVTFKDETMRQSIHCGEIIAATGGRHGGATRKMLVPRGQKPTTFEVQPNRNYIVGLNDGSHERLIFSLGTTPGPWKVSSCEREVSVQEGQYLTRVVLDPNQELGRLIIDVEDATSEDAYHLQIDSLASGHSVHSGNVSADQLPLTIELAPGDYRVNVNCSVITVLELGSVGIHQTVGQKSDSEFHVDAGWQDAKVRSGGDWHMVYHFGTGGRLRVATPVVVNSASDLFATLGVHACGIRNYGEIGASREFELENAKGERTRRIVFKSNLALTMQSPEPAGYNWRELSHPLSVGSYVLRWRDSNDEVHEEPFTIRAREMTAVTFDSK